MSISIYETYGIEVPEKRHLVPEATVRRHLESLEAYGFARGEVRATVKRLPALLGYTAERTGRNILLVRSAGIDVREHTALLILAPDLLQGRIAYTKQEGLALTPSLLGQSNKAWEKRFGLTRDEVIAIGQE